MQTREGLALYLKTDFISQVWQSIPVIPALGRLRQEDQKFKAILVI
jgi:hypothetical protein